MMIDELDKKNESSLADDEIASLMKTLASNKYRENPYFPKKVIQPFKPLSLPEMASKATEENVYKKSKPEEKNQATIDKQISDEESSTNDHGSQSDTASQEAGNSHVVEDNESARNMIETKSDEQSTDGSSEENNEDSNIDAISLENPTLNEEKEISNQAEKTAIGVPIKEKLYTESEKEEAYQNGIAETTKKFETAQATRIEKSLKTFETLIERLEENITIDTSLLERKLKEEILKISSERVGAAILEMPEKFTEKIENLAQAIKSKANNHILKLNPEDYENVSNLMNESKILSKFSISADQTLEHGDSIIEVGGVSLEDSLQNRYNSDDQPGVRNFELANSEDGRLPTPDENSDFQSKDTSTESETEEIQGLADTQEAHNQNKNVTNQNESAVDKPSSPTNNITDQEKISLPKDLEEDTQMVADNILEDKNKEND